MPEEAFERRSCADGAKGPREYDWATVHLAPTAHGLERHLLIRRSTVPNKKDRKTGELVREIAYFLCHTAPGETMAELVTAAGQRWMVEESFQVAKGQVGFRRISVARDDGGALDGGFHAMSDHLPGPWAGFARSGGLPTARA